MTTLNRQINIYIDGDKPGGADCALAAKTSTPGGVLTIMAGDYVPCKVFFRRKSDTGAASAALALQTGATVVVSGKPLKSLSDAVPLFAATSFVSDGSTDDQGYLGTLDLNTSEIAAAMTALTAGKKYLDIEVDIEVRDAGNTERVTYRISAQLYRQAYDGGTAPSPVTLPPLIMTDTVDGSRWQLSVADGQLTITKV